jgi:hypothetical protein
MSFLKRSCVPLSKTIALLFLLTACNPPLNFTNTNPNPGIKVASIDDEETKSIDDTIAAVEEPTPPPAVVKEAPPEKVQQTVVLPEVEKEIANMDKKPEHIETINPNDFVTTAAPAYKPKTKTSKPKTKSPRTATARVHTAKVESSDPQSEGDTELFEQKPAKVDILFVVDNSPSMAKEQKQLGERLQSFMKQVRNMDWQIAFTTTDVTSRKYGIKGSLLELAGHPGQKVLTADFTDAEDVFYNTVQRPEGRRCFLFGCPSSKEQPLKASILAMQKHDTDDAAFFRDDADLAIVVLSDEDEMSGGGKRATKPEQVVEAFHSIFGNEKKLSVYGIVIQPKDNSCYEEQKEEGTSASAGTYVTELSRMTNGYVGSICDNDYAVALEKIGEETRLASDFYLLKRVPIENSVKVKLVPEQDIPWKIKGDRLTFANSPKPGTIVQVSYNYKNDLDTRSATIANEENSPASQGIKNLK